MNDCIFCKIAQKEAPAEIVLEKQTVIAFKNIHPVAEVHFLLMPKEHIESIMQIQDSGFFKEMIITAQELIQKNNIEKGYKLVFNGGKYQAIPHLHWHLLGGKLEDERDILNQT